MITRNFNNQPTWGLEVEYQLQKNAMVWSAYDPNTTKDILISFLFIFTNGLAVDVLANVVLDGVEIGQFSTSNDTTLQQIIDGASYESSLNKAVCEEEPIIPFIENF